MNFNRVYNMIIGYTIGYTKGYTKGFTFSATPNWYIFLIHFRGKHPFV